VWSTAERMRRLVRALPMVNTMTFAVWALLVGVLSIAMALTGTLLRRLPMSPAMFYLAAGVGLGPVGLGLLSPDPVADAGVLEHVTEVAVLISLFSVGLKLGPPRRGRRWSITLRLAFGSMLVTVAVLAVAAVLVLGLDPAAAVLLGALLAPTDPVLASDVQLESRDDRDRLRFSLTGEGGLNDGTAFPFVMLGLGLLGRHELGTAGWRWIAVDVLWAIAGGVVVGAALGTAVGKLVVHLRTRHQEAVGLDEFLALGLIAVASGAALLLHAYGFLAVFAAGVALRRATDRSRRGAAEDAASVAEEEAATHSARAGDVLTTAVGSFNAQLERFAELAVVLALGAMLPFVRLDGSVVLFLAVLFLVARPLAVILGLAGVAVPLRERALISWFGIRGIGSVYYLMYAIDHGLPDGLPQRLTEIALAAVAVSIVVHGVSVSPLMGLHASSNERAAAR
jgi:sodium/hydrogen antiporter